MKENNFELPVFVNHETGEIVSLEGLRPKEFENVLKTMPDNLVSHALSRTNYVSRLAAKLEKLLKDHIKNKGIEFDEDGKGTFVDWKVSQIKTRRFSEKKLLLEGTEEEKELYKKLKEKYSEETENIKFG